VLLAVLIVVAVVLLALGALAVWEARRLRVVARRDRPEVLEGRGSHLRRRR